MQGDYSLGELAVRFGLELRGDPALRISHVATLHHAGDGALSFLANSRYRKHLVSTRASAVVVAPADAQTCPVAVLVAANPYLAYARIATLLYPVPPVAAGIHPSAMVAAAASVASSAGVGALCVIEAGAVVGERVQLGAGCIVLAGARIGWVRKMIGPTIGKTAESPIAAGTGLPRTTAISKAA